MLCCNSLKGIGLVCVSVVADAFLPNFQERVFEHGSSRVEVTYFTNILCLMAMSTSFSLTGENPFFPFSFLPSLFFFSCPFLVYFFYHKVIDDVYCFQAKNELLLVNKLLHMRQIFYEVILLLMCQSSPQTLKNLSFRHIFFVVKKFNFCPSLLFIHVFPCLLRITVWCIESIIVILLLIRLLQFISPIYFTIIQFYLFINTLKCILRCIYHFFLIYFFSLKCCTGDLQAAVGYALSNPHALLLMVIYTFLAYIAITFHMALVQEFGGITTGKIRSKIMNQMLFPSIFVSLFLFHRK